MNNANYAINAYYTNYTYYTDYADYACKHTSADFSGPVNSTKLSLSSLAFAAFPRGTVF